MSELQKPLEESVLDSVRRGLKFLRNIPDETAFYRDGDAELEEILSKAADRIAELESPWHSIEKDGYPSHDGEVLVFYAADISPPIEIDYLESDPETGAEYFANDPDCYATYWMEKPETPKP